MAGNGNVRAPGGAPPRVGNNYAIDVPNFISRAKALYAHWREHSVDLWGSANVLAVATPPASDDLRYLKSSALNIWLLGYEFPDTIMVFTSKQIHFLCSRNKATLLEVVRNAALAELKVEVIMHVKPKGDDGTGLMDAIFRAIRGDGNDSQVVGHIAREVPEGKLLETWSERLKNANFQFVDITGGLSDLFAGKDVTEIVNVKKAAYLAYSVMKNVVVPKLENVIDEEKDVTHSALMDVTEKAILEPTKANVKLRAENVDICYPPIFQSGGKFDLKPSAASNDELLTYDPASIIICAVGARYNSYCSNVARTYLIDANSLQSKAYEVLLKAHEAAINALRSGRKISTVYQAALSVVEKEAPELVDKLTKSAGTGIGLEFRESGLNINAKNDKVLRPQMVFNVSLGFQNLECESESRSKNKKFSLLLADTVIVKDQTPEILTKCSKSVKDVAYSFKEDEEEERPRKKPRANGRENYITKTALRSDDHVDNEVETSSVNPDPRPKKRKSKGGNVEKSKKRKVSKSEDTQKAVERRFDNLLTTETCEESKNLSRRAVSFFGESPVMRIDGCDVFRATRDARNVAAKRIPITTSALQNVEKEMKLNYMAENVSDRILICYGMEVDDKYIYLFFQPWQCTLGELVRFCSRQGSKEDCLCKEFLVKFEKNNSLWLEDDGPSDLLTDILKDVIGGVSDLHKSCIIHAKINVDNICIVSKGQDFKAKITGFGSAMGMALENLQLKNRMVDDLVALGRVLGFSLAHGNSLHNNVDVRRCVERSQKINKGAKKILKKSHDAYELVQNLTKPHGRCCTAIEALAHPFFWPLVKKISFIQVASERFMSARYNQQFVYQVNKSGHKVMKANWLAAIDEALKDELCKLVHYNSKSLFDLIRCIRNQLEHYKSVQENTTLKNLFGDSQESMLRYFTSRFPNLLVEMHQIVSRHFKEEPEFKCYFPTD